ncbi:phosphoglycerate dehydrogenase [Corynebacterium testudinoris]|uniref:D-3-phosphoglycerate dehydrogenase n=1 Tax=Corynebacterium testudinoris TaxID=136857 RepID=A0A0G3H598_9CORY|nr:phosphoglycerate dehydrogenase [Corynebacterium testudinoris]AKK08579.1 D-3-phosphoglycerate dehydrogenase [Corynebacterium testudinoris]MBX8994790.1 phosphoglycerate dehydrogenase [Corynebacterium testudinoris]
MSKPVVLIADKLAPSTVEALGDSVEVRWVDGPNTAELLAAVPEADALLVRSATTVTREVLEAAPNLKIVGRAGVGLDNVDIAAATDRGVMVVNAPTSNIHSACEHAIALLMATVRQIPAADATLREGEWKRSAFNGVEIFGKTIGVVGFGHIGQLFAQRLSAFETKIIAFDPYANPARAAQLGVELVDLDELVSRADIITIHLPKTKETAGMFNAELLAKSKKGQIIINAARGGLVDEQALADAIKSGHIWGAGFDVYSTEPCTDSPLFDLPQVIVTPHLGASTAEAQDRAGTDVADSVLKALAGEFVPDAVNVSGGRVGEEVALWLELTRKLGLLAGRLLDAAPVALEVEARGELSTEDDLSVLGLSAVRGLFSGITDEPVTFVNAPTIAESRGLDYQVDTASESSTHRSSVEVKAIASDGSTSIVVGALTGLERVEKIVRIDARGVDMRAEGRNLFLQYTDAPGALGKVGSQLGDAGINIEAAALTQAAKGDGATLILRVDSEIPEALEKSIAESLGATSVQIDLS